MNLNKKSGVTLASLVIYIVLFTSFSIFIAATSANMNNKLFDNRGEAINYSSLNKLQYNIENSSLNSNNVSLVSDTITYSNGDSYSYDSEKNVVYKNGGILCTNVDNFTVNMTESGYTKKIVIEVTFNKYLNVMTRTIISCVEV